MASPVCCACILPQRHPRPCRSLATKRVTESEGSWRSIAEVNLTSPVECGCDGVISSGLEAPQIKVAFGDRLTIVTPGIRPVLSGSQKSADDQKRTVDVAQAFSNGADHIVVGRPIREAANPRAAAEVIQTTIAGIFPA